MNVFRDAMLQAMDGEELAQCEEEWIIAEIGIEKRTLNESRGGV